MTRFCGSAGADRAQCASLGEVVARAWLPAASGAVLALGWSLRVESRLELPELLPEFRDLPAFGDELGGEAVQGEAESLSAKLGLGSRQVGMMLVSGHGVP